MAEPVVKVLPNSLDSGRLQEETKAAEDFEQISDYQFDFGIDWLFHSSFQCNLYVCVVVLLSINLLRERESQREQQDPRLIVCFREKSA